MRKLDGVAIYLDTNVMYGWHTFAELDRLALTILASELGQEIIIPSLVAEELEGHTRRQLERAAAKFEAASSRAERLFELDYVMTEPVLDVDLVLARWRTALEDAFGMCDVTADDALTGLRREVVGTPPARRPDANKPGVGGRDAAIWLAVVRDHADRGEPGFFVTRDKGFWDGEKMKPRLAEDVADGAEPLTLHKSVESFLIGLGEHDEVEVDPDDVRVRALPLIKSGLERSPLLPRAVFDRDFYELEVRTDVTDGTIEHVERARRFVGDLGEILLIDATWRLDFRLLYRDRPPAEDILWFVVDELDARGQVQVYLGQPHSETTGGQFIAAQLKPRQTARRSGTGLTIMSALDD
jgi:rRNA-processing protein FCF1